MSKKDKIMAKEVKMDKNGPKWTKTYNKQAIVKLSRKMVYRVENDEIGRKEIKKVENVLTGTNGGLRYDKGGVRYVKRGQNWLKR